MSILSVDNISPIGSGTSVTVNSAATLVLTNANSTGVITATNFVGNLTGTASQVTIANGANNRILTAASSNTINAESNVLYDGTNFGIGKSPSRTLDVQGKIRSSDSVCFGDNSSTPSEGAAIHRPANSALAFVTNNAERVRINSSGQVGISTHSPSAAWLDIASDSGSYDHIRLRRISSDSNIASNWSMKPYGGNLYFRTGGSTDKIYFDDSGDLNIMDGNLLMGTSGHGIDFAVTSDGPGNASELLDDYEEGSWTPTISAHLGGGSFTTNAAGRYIKVGRLVSLWGQLSWSAKGGSGVVNLNVTGLPFATHNTAANNSSVCIGSRSGWNQLRLVGQMYQTGYINVQYINSSGNSVNVNVSSLDNSGSIYYRFQYESAA